MIKVFSLLFLLASLTFAQTSIAYFPDSLMVAPFTANFLEPKMGFLFTTGKNDLRLDIGNSRDLLHYSHGEGVYASFGADFFTYTKLRGEKDFHFPVDAVDYLFGFNGSYVIRQEKTEKGLRFRFSHISAHFVDGHFDHRTATWRNGMEPRVYSREFIEITPFYKWGELRGYTSFTYLLNVTPDYIKRWIVNAGAEYFYPVQGIPATPFFAVDMRTTALEKIAVSHTLTLGIKLGKPFEPGLSAMFTYFNGLSIHGEYFDVREKYTSFGINIDL